MDGLTYKKTITQNEFIERPQDIDLAKAHTIDVIVYTMAHGLL
jgi:hypothetical protein